MGWSCIMNGPDSDGGDVGETAARVATATMKLLDEMDDAIAQQWTSSMSSSLPEGAAHAPLKIEARGSKPARCAGFRAHPTMVYFSIFWMPWSWGSLTTRTR